MKTDKSDKSRQTIMPGSELSRECTSRKSVLEVQRQVDLAEGLFQGDVTIRTLLESLAEGIVVIDSSASIVLVNRQVEKLFGYAKEDIVGQPLDLLIPEKHRTAHPKHVAGYFEKPKIRPMGLEQELAARHKDGHDIPVEISLSHLETASGRLAMAFITDITLRKEAINNLEARNEELDSFAHTVAHDLRGSLASLIGYSELLNAPDVNLDQGQIQESLATINRIGRKMSDVVDGLLLLSRVSREDVEVAPLEMHLIINEVTFRLGEEIKDKGAELTLAADFPTALGYAPWIEEVWYNYLSNAVKYGGTPPRISLGGEVLDTGQARFWVKDNGPGLSPADQVELFVPYSLRADSSEGNGLGLSIVKRIVEKLHGCVGVESEVDEGSLFSFTLPLVK